MSKTLLFLTILSILNIRQSLSFKIYTTPKGIIHYRVYHSFSDARRATLYFDDYGRKQVIEIAMGADSLEDHLKVVQVDSVQYGMVDSLRCFKSQRSLEFNLVTANFTNLNDNAIKKYGIPGPKQTIFLGLNCDRYQFNYLDWTVEVIEWNKVPLLIQTKNVKTGEVEETRADKIQTRAYIAPNTFNLPKNIQIMGPKYSLLEKSDSLNQYNWVDLICSSLTKSTVTESQIS